MSSYFPELLSELLSGDQLGDRSCDQLCVRTELGELH
jgi:hypothetical protein